MGDITRQDLDRAIDDLATLRFFPKEGRARMMEELASMCPHKKALKWTVTAVLAATSDWPGLKEVRGILCSRFDPADGIDAWSSLPGYSAEEGEQKTITAHEELKRAEIAPGSQAIIRQLTGLAPRKATP